MSKIVSTFVLTDKREVRCGLDTCKKQIVNGEKRLVYRHRPRSGLRISKSFCISCTTNLVIKLLSDADIIKEMGFNFDEIFKDRIHFLATVRKI